MKFECPNCKKAGAIEDSKVPDGGVYANCPNCQTRFLIKIQRDDFSFTPAQEEQRQRPQASVETNRVAQSSIGVGEPMTFSKSIATCFSKYFTFGGRASRAEFWWFFLFTFLLELGSGFADSTGVLGWIITLVTLIPSLSVGSRRLHDTNRSGWWQLVSLTGIGILLLIYQWVCKSDEQANRFGSPVKGARQQNLWLYSGSGNLPSS